MEDIFTEDAYVRKSNETIGRRRVVKENDDIMVIIKEELDYLKGCGYKLTSMSYYEYSDPELNFTGEKEIM